MSKGRVPQKSSVHYDPTSDKMDTDKDLSTPSSRSGPVVSSAEDLVVLEQIAPPPQLRIKMTHL